MHLLLELTKHYIDNFPPEIRLLKIAVVTSKEFKEVAETWESLCVSRGFRYNAFTSFEEAEDWLIK